MKKWKRIRKWLDFKHRIGEFASTNYILFRLNEARLTHVTASSMALLAQIVTLSGLTRALHRAVLACPAQRRSVLGLPFCPL